ncbi:MAG: hypothetical protein ACE5IK_02165 [Acidobacteriota bacterium]
MRKLDKLVPAAAATAAILTLGMPILLARGHDVSTFHVEVQEEDSDSPKVKMEFPVALLEAMVNSIDIEDFTSDHLLGEFADQGIDLKAFWRQVRDADIKEFFTLEADDAHIRAWREDGLFRVSVQADDQSDGPTHVEIRIPEQLMDLLVEPDQKPADVVAALLDHGPMTLVEVESDHRESVRVWLD